MISRAADGTVGVWDLGPDGDATGHLAAFGAQDAVKAGDDLVILAGGAITTTPIDTPGEHRAAPSGWPWTSGPTSWPWPRATRC